jgi:hypothetical protein
MDKSKFVKKLFILQNIKLFCISLWERTTHNMNQLTKKTGKSAEDWDALFNEITEAFTPGAPIRLLDMLAGRKEQIYKLVDVVHQQGKHGIIFGERGVGKTSLANTFALGLNSKTKKLLLIKINADPNDSYASLWKKIFKRLSYTCDQNGVTVIRHISDDYAGDITPDDVQIELSVFSQNSIPIIIIDEFDRVENSTVNLLMADTIKALADYAVNCTLLIIGVAEDISKLISSHESVSRQLVQIKMPRMHRDELVKIITDRLIPMQMTIDEDVLWGIPFLSSGLPYFTHLLGMHCGRAAIKDCRMRIEKKDFNIGMSNALKEVDQTLTERYNAAIISKRPKETLFESVLLACALAEPDELGRFQQKSIESPLALITKGKNYKSTTYAFHMNEFCGEKRGQILEICSEESNPRYRFKDPMMQPYVILKGLEGGKIENEISKRLIPQRQTQLFPTGS